LGAPKFLFHLIALIKLLLRYTNSSRTPKAFGAGKTKTNEQNRRGSLPKPNFNLD